MFQAASLPTLHEAFVAWRAVALLAEQGRAARRTEESRAARRAAIERCVRRGQELSDMVRNHAEWYRQMQLAAVTWPARPREDVVAAQPWEEQDTVELDRALFARALRRAYDPQAVEEENTVELDRAMYAVALRRAFEERFV